MQILPKETTYVSICSFTRTMNHKTHYLCNINQGKCHADKIKTMIEIRKTLPTELEVLMDIFEQAKRIMRKDGNMHQWTGNYPSRELVMADIEQGNSYVCTDDTGEIIGTFAFIRETTLHMHISTKENGWKTHSLTESSTGWQAQSTAKEWPMPACNGATNKSPTYVQIPTGTTASCNTY